MRVWQAGMELAESIYQLTATFPAQEMYGLTSQLRRAAVSVPSNIAEGHTRESTKEYLHHISMAQASLAEVQTQVELAGRLGYAAADKIATSSRPASPLASSYSPCVTHSPRKLATNP